MGGGLNHCLAGGAIGVANHARLAQLGRMQALEVWNGRLLECGAPHPHPMAIRHAHFALAINTHMHAMHASSCSSELDRPENSMLKPVVEKLKKAKAKIDDTGARTGAGPISWADLLVVAGKCVTSRARPRPPP